MSLGGLFQGVSYTLLNPLRRRFSGEKIRLPGQHGAAPRHATMRGGSLLRRRAARARSAPKVESTFGLFSCSRIPPGRAFLRRSVAARLLLTGIQRMGQARGGAPLPRRDRFAGTEFRHRLGAARGEERKGGFQEDGKVETKGAAADIEEVEAELLFPANRVAPGNLGQTREPGADIVAMALPRRVAGEVAHG